MWCGGECSQVPVTCFDAFDLDGDRRVKLTAAFLKICAKYRFDVVLVCGSLNSISASGKNFLLAFFERGKFPCVENVFRNFTSGSFSDGFFF